MLLPNLLLPEASNILSYRDNITDYQNNEWLVKALKVDAPLEKIDIEEELPSEIGSNLMEIDPDSPELRIEDGLNEGPCLTSVRSIF